LIFVLAAFVWGLASVGLAWRYPGRLRAEATQGFANALGRELAHATSDAERIAVANDALREVSFRLEVDQRMPKTAGWIGVAGVATILVVGALMRPEAVLGVGLIAVAMGVIGAAWAKRRGDREAAATRERADAVVASMVGELYDAEIVSPERPQRRFRRRR
jgi:hypothetical protein